MLDKIKLFLFHNLSVRQTVAKNTFWLGVSNVGGRLLRAIIIIYAARILGASEWGIFSYAVSLVALLAVFTDIGISPILIRETAKFRDNIKVRREILSTSFILKLILLALGILVILFIAPHITAEEGVKAILPIVVFILVFDTFREFSFSLIRALEKMEWEAFFYLITNVAIVAFGFIFLAISQTITAFTYAYALGTGIGMGVTMIVLRKDLRGLLSNFSFGLAKTILSAGWPFAISAVLGVLMINTDILLIGWLRSSEEVGLYSAAQRIVQLLYLLPGILAVALLPTFARFANRENQKLRSILEKTLGFVYMAAIPLSIGGFILGGEIINFIFGNSYAGASYPFKILIATIIIDFPVVILSGLVFAYNKQKSLIKYAAIGGISNVFLDVLLIPRFGIIGSAITTLVAQLLSNVYLWRVAKRVNHFRILPHLKKILIASLLMAVVVLLLKALAVHVLLVIGAGILTYFSLLFLFREPLFKEVRLILQPVASDEQASSEQNA